MIDKPKQPNEAMKTKDKQIQDNEIKFQQSKFKYQQYLFYVILGASLLIALCILYLIYLLFTEGNEITTQMTIIVVSIATIPVIMILALMRYIYDGKKSDSPHPTLILNVGKELAGVIQEIVKSKP